MNFSSQNCVVLKLSDGIIKNRIWLLLLFFFFLFLLLVGRLIDLQIIRHHFFQAKALEQRLKVITLAADRGDIFDCVGRLLATSIDTYSIYIVPSQIKNKGSMARKLSRILGMRYIDVINKMYKKKPFVWLKRKADKEKASRIRAAKLPGVYMLSEKKRIYPKGALASQVLGFVGIDNHGLSGIELGFEKYLKGEEGKIITESDPRGREILGATGRQLQAQTLGLNIYLTIDETIQYIAEREIEAAVAKYRANSGTVIVMDAKSGEILALASKPDFDPNLYQNYNPRRWHPRVVGNVYEPGSTFKLITVASALNEQVISPDTRIYCPDRLEVGGRWVRNSHTFEAESKNMKPEEILAYSVNTGAAQIGIKLGPERLMKYIKAFGFGKEMRIGLPGESRGIVRETKDWSKPDIGMISFGQGIAVTPLQLASAVCVIANDGRMIKPILVKRIEAVDGSTVKVIAKKELGQVISPKVARKLRGMMEEVILRGTGKLAKIKGFRIGGKTGTAEKVKPGGKGYWHGHYIPSFVGIAPLSDPKIVVLVVIDDPKGRIFWGERVAAPVFKTVTEETLRYLNVAPDEIASSP